jgi:hypothetical protein
MTALGARKQVASVIAEAERASADVKWKSFINPLLAALIAAFDSSELRRFCDNATILSYVVND